MNLLEAGREISVLDNLADCYHYDLIDNHCAPSLGLPLEFLLQIRSVSSLAVDIHLMVEDVEGMATTLLGIGVDMITIPVEQITSNAFRLIAQVKAGGARVGIALNPITPVESLLYILPTIDKVTVLTVDPGLIGQSFIPITLNKLSSLVKIRESNGYDYDIEVDGSCNEANYISMLNSGANQFVVGTSGLFSLDKNIEIAWQKMKNYMDT